MEKSKKIQSEADRAIYRLLYDAFIRVAQGERNVAKTTLHQYRSAAKALLRGGYELTGEVDWLSAIVAFEHLRAETLSKWSVRKAALKLIAGTLVFPLMWRVRIEAVKRPETDEKWPTDRNGRKNVALDPVARKMLVENLGSRNVAIRPAALLASNLLLTGVLVGLRPSEWPTARLVKEDGLKWLRTRTLRQKSSETSERRLGIEGFSGTDIELIERMVATSVKSANDWPGVLQQVSRLLRDTCVDLFGRDNVNKYNVYNARHQFAANTRLVYADRIADVVVLLGYDSFDALYKYAGPELSECDKAWPEDVETIRDVPFAHPDDVDALLIFRKRAYRPRSRRKTHIDEKG